GKICFVIKIETVDKSTEVFIAYNKSEEDNEKIDDEQGPGYSQQCIANAPWRYPQGIAMGSLGRGSIATPRWNGLSCLCHHRKILWNGEKLSFRCFLVGPDVAVKFPVWIKVHQFDVVIVAVFSVNDRRHDAPDTVARKIPHRHRTDNARVRIDENDGIRQAGSLNFFIYILPFLNNAGFPFKQVGQLHNGIQRSG